MDTKMQLFPFTYALQIETANLCFQNEISAAL